VAILLFRVDERLIHGQVVLGWGSRLRPAEYVVVDDGLAASPWEQELYLLALPDGVHAVFTTVGEALALLPRWRNDRVTRVLLTAGVESMRELARGGGMTGGAVNLGGLHHAPERERYLPFLHLSEGETHLLRELEAEGVDVSAQDLPSSGRVSLRELLS